MNEDHPVILPNSILFKWLRTVQIELHE